MADLALTDRLAEFKGWWLRDRPFLVPFEAPVMTDGNIWGAVLYRSAPWQVQLFVLKADSVVPDHQHPNVDSFEVYLSGDIEFSLEGLVVTPMLLSEHPDFTGAHQCVGKSIRVPPLSWHGAKSGHKGGMFLSIQQWLNGVPPTNVGDDWTHRDGETRRNFHREDGGA